MAFPIRALWVKYAIASLVVIFGFQVAYNWIEFGIGLDAAQQQYAFVQLVGFLASFDMLGLILFLDYARRAEPSVNLMEKAAIILGGIMNHHMLRGLNEKEATAKVIQILDQVEAAGPLLEGLRSIKPHHVERGIKILNLVLAASDQVSDEVLASQLGAATARWVETNGQTKH